MSGPQRIHRTILNLCEELGLDGEIRIGGKHYKLYVNGRLVRVLSFGTNATEGPNGIKATLIELRRIARQGKTK